MMPWLLCALGLVILLLAGDSLVKGAVNLSLRLGVPPLIVSLTIVAFGTSAPELLISIKAILDNSPGMALGNVVGSNTANVLMVLGFPALIAAMHTSECDSKGSYIQMMGATVLFIALAFTGQFHGWTSFVLLAALAAMLLHAFMSARAHRNACEPEVELEEADPSMPMWRIMVFLGLGLIGLPIGANILVENAEIIARWYGVSETVIGLSLIAIGTSLPELATTVMAAIRRQADVALGNVIGSNMFNLLAIVGIASLFGPIPVDPTILQFDMWVMLAASLALIPFVFLRQDITRLWGGGLAALYVAYLVVILV
jgi:cation:H+ antiporter